MSTDPFDLPPEPVTLDADPFDTPPPEVVEVPASAVEVVTTAAGLGAAAVAAIPTAARQVEAFASDLGAALADRLDAGYQAVLAQRPDGKVTPTTVQPELVWLADAHDALAAMGRAFADRAKAARDLAGEVVLEVHDDRPVERTGGSASVKVGATGGEAVKVTATQPTEAFVSTAQIVAHLTDWLAMCTEHGGRGPEQAAYALGLRDMAAALLGLDGQLGYLAAPKWKTTALDVLVGQMEGAGQTELAAWLRDSYGRRPVGNVQTKIDRVQTVREV